MKPEDRRALIVKAAADEFGRRGHKGARREDIARAAGVGLAVLAVNPGLSPEELTGLAMDILYPGIEALSRP